MNRCAIFRCYALLQVVFFTVTGYLSARIPTFKADTSGHLRLLCCTDALTENVHAEDGSGVILLCPTISALRRGIGASILITPQNTSQNLTGSAWSGMCMILRPRPSAPAICPPKYGSRADANRTRSRLVSKDKYLDRSALFRIGTLCLQEQYISPEPQTCGERIICLAAKVLPLST